MLLGLDVLPEYRGQGLARELVYRYSQREKANGRKKLFLTCLEQKVEMYKSLDCRIWELLTLPGAEKSGMRWC